MRRLLFLALVALIVVPSAEAQSAPTDTPVFTNFQHRVCHLAKTMNSKAAPSVVTFNDQYYNAEHTTENLLLAGEAAQRVYAIYANYNKPLLKIPAPRGDGRLWKRYKQLERDILRLGFLGATALKDDELSRFEHIKTKNENEQAKRNAIWSQIGIVCS